MKRFHEMIMEYIKPKKKDNKSFTYRDLLKQLKSMSEYELDCCVLVSKDDTMTKVKELITTTVEIDTCNPGDSYFILED